MNRCDECGRPTPRVWCDPCADHLAHIDSLSDRDTIPAVLAPTAVADEGGPFRLEGWAADRDRRWGNQPR